MTQPRTPETIGTGEPTPQGAERIFIVPVMFDCEHFQEGKQQIRRIYKPKDSGGWDVFTHTKTAFGDSYTRETQDHEGVTRGLPSQPKGSVFDKVWGLENPKLEFTRFRIPYGDHTILYDEYGGELSGLRIANVELSDETKTQAEAFEPPAWFGDGVTGNQDFDPLALATKGSPV
ncbi:hypothetical protein A3F37_01590 [Candidatus Saccharibacteria bacterium RIFCSPHIGHO2_12_FULL_41_12]|nr:MAG: hypothetical protein A3F37_01590 [Candidatus Saccharibacteria bacterium RIFCSPHIGHO2_12_FULL_41_12]